MKLFGINLDLLDWTTASTASACLENNDFCCFLSTMSSHVVVDKWLISDFQTPNIHILATNKSTHKVRRNAFANVYVIVVVNASFFQNSQNLQTDLILYLQVAKIKCFIISSGKHVRVYPLYPTFI